MSRETIDFDIDDIIAETDKAWLVDIDGDEYWLPKSICEIYNDQVTMPEWLAEKQGLL